MSLQFTSIAVTLAAGAAGAVGAAGVRSAPLGEDALEQGIEAVAYMDGDSLAVGDTAAFVVEVLFPDGATASESGAPAPFVQFDVPDSVKLGGRYLETYDELAANEFLQEPYERLLEEQPTLVPFTLVAEPEPGATIGINVVAYVRPEGGDDGAFFLRRRLELPLEAGAMAEEGDPRDSSWGVDDTLLQIGDRAPSFELPMANGSTFSFASVLGKKRVLLTTYRAHW